MLKGASEGNTSRHGILLLAFKGGVCRVQFKTRVRKQKKGGGEGKDLHSEVPAGTLTLKSRNGIGMVTSHGSGALAVGFSGIPLAMQFAGTLIPNRSWSGVMVFCPPPSILLSWKACA